VVCSGLTLSYRYEYRSFPRLCDAVLDELKCEAVLDAGIVCLDADGRPQFYELLRRRGAGTVRI
jgi:ATP-dependent DNA ligase